MIGHSDQRHSMGVGGVSGYLGAAVTAPATTFSTANPEFLALMKRILDQNEVILQLNLRLSQVLTAPVYTITKP